MKRAVFIFALILGFTRSAAAQPFLSPLPSTWVGTYTLGLGSGPTIDVYKIGFDAGEGNTINSLIVEIGTAAGLGWDDPFQAGWRTGGKTPQTYLTPTQEDANDWLLPMDGTKCYECDTHFLPPGIGTWEPSAAVPNEVNDASIYGVHPEDYVAGVGSLSVAVAVPEEYRTQFMDVVQIGVIRGTGVAGRINGIEFAPVEPTTGLLLGAGTVMLLRRRRVRQRVASPM